MNVRVTVGGLVLAPAALFGQTAEVTSNGAGQPLPLQSGKIVMYRGSSLFGAGVACPIRYKGQEVVELARGKYAEWSVQPGRYLLTNRTSSVEVAVDPGETRYVRCMLKMGLLAGRADLQIVDEESFNEHGNEYELKPLSGNFGETPSARPTSAQARR